MSETGVGLLGDVSPAVVAALREAELPVRGVLADLFAPPPDGGVRRYDDLADVLADARGPLRAVVLPAASPLAPALTELVAAGVPVLLPDAAPWDADLLREARAAAAEADVAVAVLLTERHAGWARLVSGAVSGRRAAQQLTVRGWPRGPAAAAELVDLVRAWCGDVVAAAAAPAQLPATVLPDGEPVAWALLTERGTTVLVAHEGAGPRCVLSLPPTRLLAGPQGVSWEGGDAVVAASPADPTPAAFARAVAAGTAELVGSSLEPWPWPADLADLVPTARVLAALRASARTEAWAELR